MTKKELREISQEIDYISERVALLDPGNAIENQLREQLFHRWDFLDYRLEVALISVKKNSDRWSIVNGGFTSSSVLLSHFKTMKQKFCIVS